MYLGKSTMFDRLKYPVQQKSIDEIPDVEFNVEKINICEGVDFFMWDIGASFELRELWRHYFSSCAGNFSVYSTT